MSKCEVIEYKCDVCGKVFSLDKLNTEEPLVTLRMPSIGHKGRKGMTLVDMCESCFDIFSDYIHERYKVSDFGYGVKVEVVGDE